MNEAYESLLNVLIAEGVLDPNSREYEAFASVDRIDFVLQEYKSQAYENRQLPIGHNQTISQPYVVAHMISLLDVKPGNKILEIGYGSGWQTVILSKLVGSEGKVYAVEIIPELKEFGDKNIAKYDQTNIETYLAEKDQLGLPDIAPFDRIISGASAAKLPQELIDQLDIDGLLVTPVDKSGFDQEIVVLRKTSESDHEVVNRIPGVRFVPMVGS